jgi:hypothetical protein
MGPIDKSIQRDGGMSGYKYLIVFYHKVKFHIVSYFGISILRLFISEAPYSHFHNHPSPISSRMDSQAIYDIVNSRYSASALSSACTSCGKSVAQAFGYSTEELASIPQEANLGLSCGNPLALTSLNEGETVVDLGSGAGFDVFLAARKVSEKGKAIGVDMNEVWLLLHMASEYCGY